MEKMLYKQKATRLHPLQCLIFTTNSMKQPLFFLKCNHKKQNIGRKCRRYKREKQPKDKTTSAGEACPTFYKE